MSQTVLGRVRGPSECVGLDDTRGLALRVGWDYEVLLDLPLLELLVRGCVRALTDSGRCTNAGSVVGSGSAGRPPSTEWKAKSATAS